MYGRNIPTVSRPGEASSISAVSFFLQRTMGLTGERMSLSSSSVGSAYLFRASMSRTITAKGFCSLPYHFLRSGMRSRVQ